MKFDDELAMRTQTDQVLEELARRKQAARLGELYTFDDRNVDEEIRDDYTEPVWRITGMHIATSFTTITAPQKTGKSTLMLNLIRSLVDGVPFLGRHVTPVTGKVAYWNMELDKNVWLRWVQEIHLENRKQVIAQHLRGVKFPLWNGDLYHRAVEWLKRNQIEVLIIDPGHKILRGWPKQGNGSTENNNDVVADVCQMLRELVNHADVVDLFVPLHTGVGSGGEFQHTRGAAMWGDEPDHLWNLWKKELVKGEGEVRHFGAFGRDVDVDTLLIKYDKHTHLYLPEDSADQVQHRQWAHAVQFTLTKYPSLTWSELRKHTRGPSNANFTAALQAAIDEGLVEKFQDDKGKDRYRKTDMEAL